MWCDTASTKPLKVKSSTPLLFCVYKCAWSDLPNCFSEMLLCWAVTITIWKSQSQLITGSEAAKLKNEKQRGAKKTLWILWLHSTGVPGNKSAPLLSSFSFLSLCSFVILHYPHFSPTSAVRNLEFLEFFSVRLSFLCFLSVLLFQTVSPVNPVW